MHRNGARSLTTNRNDVVKLHRVPRRRLPDGRRKAAWSSHTGYASCRDIVRSCIVEKRPVDPGYYSGKGTDANQIVSALAAGLPPAANTVSALARPPQLALGDCNVEELQHSVEKETPSRRGRVVLCSWWGWRATGRDRQAN